MENEVPINEKKRKWQIPKRVFSFLATMLVLIVVLKGIVYFMPFFVAGILALIIEPVIKFLMEKLKFSRRLSSIIIITLTIIVLISLVIYGGIFIINAVARISKDIGPLVTEISATFENELEEISGKLSEYIPKEVIETIKSSIINFFGNASIYIQNALAKIMQFILSVPTMLVNVIVTILALIFFTKDRIYIIDSIEHNLPRKWVKKGSEIINTILSTLRDYIKVYVKILIITFSELFLAFSILKAIGFELDNIIVISALIALVDILPVLGVGTVLIPWTIWQFVIGNIKFGIALSIVYVIVLIIRQLIEPKLVSKQLGVHPLTTLFAMYAGFKYFGFCGLIFGPIILMILKCLGTEIK